MCAASSTADAPGRCRGGPSSCVPSSGCVDEREPEIAEALGKDLGRSAFEAWLGDVGSTKAEAAFARKHLKKWVKPKRQGLPLAQLPGRAWVQYDPLGVVLVIGPWNYPFYLCMAPLVAAVAAGNAAVIKPSELAPATSAVIARLVPQYLDSDAIRVVEGDASTTQDLLAQGFDHALFTGGTEIGRKIMAAAAPTLTPVTLELGGKSPVVVLADADLDVTARRIAWTKLLNSGQTCIAPDYVLADRTIAAPLAEKIVATIAKFRAGEQDPSLRIVNERQFDRLVSLISATSGKVVTGGGSDRSTLRIEPTVIVDPAADDPVMSDEIFGPILPIITVDSPDAAVQFVNSRPKPLALYVFTVRPAAGPRTHRPDALGRRRHQPCRAALPGAAAAVRRCRRQRDGCLPRQVGLRGAQPPPRRAGQADQTGPEPDVPALHRPGDEAHPPSLLKHAAGNPCQQTLLDRSGSP